MNSYSATELFDLPKVGNEFGLSRSQKARKIIKRSVLDELNPLTGINNWISLLFNTLIQPSPIQRLFEEKPPNRFVKRVNPSPCPEPSLLKKSTPSSTVQIKYNNQSKIYVN